MALSSVTVIAAPPVEESFAVTGTRQLVLAVDEADVTTFLTALDSLDDADRPGAEQALSR